MLGTLHQLTAAIYLAAAVTAALGLALASQRVERSSVALLAAGALLHGICFSLLHTADPPPALNDLPSAVSFMAFIGTLSFLVLLLRARLASLVVLVAPLAFLSVFVAALWLPAARVESPGGSSVASHAHVLLASAGLALLGLAGLAGALFLAEHRRLKSKRPLDRRFKLPSLEALDRVNVSALAVGFPLLTLGVVTGMIWVQTATGSWWSASAHQTWSAIAWAVYAVLASVRFTSNQGSRQAAASAVAGFVFLFFAVIGVELLA